MSHSIVTIYIQYSHFTKDKVIFVVNRLYAKWLFCCKSRYVNGKYLLGFLVGLSPIPVCSYVQHYNWVIYIEKVRNELPSSEVAPLSIFIIYFFLSFSSLVGLIGEDPQDLLEPGRPWAKQEKKNTILSNQGRPWGVALGANQASSLSFF